MKNNPLPRLDSSTDIRDKLLPYCRLKQGDVWTDPVRGHRVGCLDVCDRQNVLNIMEKERAQLSIQDPPYNLIAFDMKSINEYIKWTEKWVSNMNDIMDDNSSFYVWLGADQRNGFQPFADFILMMRKQPLLPQKYDKL